MRRRSFLAMTASLALAPIAGTMAAQTPAATRDTDMNAMLRLVPDETPQENWFLRYANYEAQLAAMGVGSDPASLDSQTWLEAVRELSVPSALERGLMDPIWRDSLGFDVRDIDAYLESDSITILRGALEGLNPMRLRQLGYEQAETSGITWYTIGDVNLLETDHYIHTLHLGYLRHVALLDDGTVVGASETAALEQVLALHAGGSGSFADGRGAGLVAPPGELALAEIADGTRLAPDLGPDELELVREEASRMPAIDIAMVGMTAGWTREELRTAAATARSRPVATLVPRNSADVAMVAETVTRRLTTDMVPESAGVGERSWVDAFPEMIVSTAPDGASVTVELTPADDVPSNILMRLQWFRELPIFYWIDPDADTDSD